MRLRRSSFVTLFNAKDPYRLESPPRQEIEFHRHAGRLAQRQGLGQADLQTEGQWADFVLQCECISNGKHLNSGLFFRARPGEYQQGYEAQIRNQFTRRAEAGIQRSRTTTRPRTR